jgi:hypothetical protein
MVIINKDGSVYKIRGPNPIMKVQDVWDGFEIHNMKFEEYVVDDKITVPKKPGKINLGQTTVITEEKLPETIQIQTPRHIEQEESPITVEVVPPPPPEKPFIKAEPTDETVIRPTNVNEKLKNYKKTILHCLPAVVKTVVDDLYMDRSFKVSYGKKFTFEAIIVEENDLGIVFWTHLENISRFSVIYPQNQEKRWWKVDNVKNAPEGFFLRCLPSSDQPAFVQR